MKHFIKFKLFLQVSIVFVLGCVATLKAQTADSTLWDGRLYVKIKSKSNVTFKDFKRGEENNLLAEMQPIATKYGLTKIFKPFTSKKEVDFVTTTYEFNFSNIKMYKEMIEDLKAIEYIEYAESVPIYKFINTPNDPFYSGGAQSATNWHLNKINAGNAWGLNGTNANVVTVAVIDNEIDINHPDLINHIWTNQFEIPGNAIDDDWNGRVDDIHGWDFSNGDNNTIGASNFSHGTHCAGLIGAVNNNSVGVSSIGGNNVNVMPIKISLDGNVSVTIDLNSAINGINYATDNGARVISMSFGGSGASTTYQNAVNYAVANGVVCVAAAGNNNASNLFYPAACNDVIAIGATDYTDHRATFSNFGTWVDVMCPGVDIYSTLNQNSVFAAIPYGFKSGTSMATPIVAGLCGLMIANNSNLTPAQIENCLETTATNIDALNPGFSGLLGAGRINADAALQCAFPGITSSFFTVSNSTPCLNNSTSLAGISTWSGITGWLWQFSSTPTYVSGSSSSQNVTVSFANSGSVDVTLTVYAPGGPYVYSQTNVINVGGLTSQINTAAMGPICNGSAQELLINIQNGTPPFNYTISNGLVTTNLTTNTYQSTFYFNADPNYPNYNISSLSDANGCLSSQTSGINLSVTNCCGNLVTNGDFEQGAVGFSSDNVFSCNGLGPGYYNVTDFSTAQLPNTINCFGNGSLPLGTIAKNASLNFDGRCGTNENSANPVPFTTPNFSASHQSRVWYQNINLTSGSTYNIDFFSSTAFPISPWGMPVQYEFQILNSGGVVIYQSSIIAHQNATEWQQNSLIWINTGYTGTATAQIVQRNFFYGVWWDILFDDISIRRTNVPPGGGAAYAGPDLSICAGNSIQLSGSGQSTYAWTPTTGLSNPAVAQPNASPAVTTTYTLTVTNACGVSTDEVTLNVNGTSCTSNNLISTPTSYLTSNTNFGFGATPSDIAINANVTIGDGVSANVVTLNCGDVRIANNVKILVKNNATLTISGSWLHTCSSVCNSSMWEGIEVESGGHLIISGNSIIEDAKTAVVTQVTSTGTLIPDLRISNTIFNKNITAIYLKDNNNNMSPSTNNIIKNCVFTCRTLASTAPSASNFNAIKSALYNGNYGSYPETNANNGKRSSRGIRTAELNSTNAYKIGVANVSAPTNGAGNINIFDNLDYGIHLYDGYYIVKNNIFKNITGNSGTGNVYGGTPFGTGIYAYSKWPNQKISIGGNGSTQGTDLEKNTFMNCLRAVDVERYSNMYVFKCNINNTFTDPETNMSLPTGNFMGQYGIYLRPNGSSMSDVVMCDNNTVNNCVYGINIYRYYAYKAANITASGNEISANGTSSNYCKVGLVIKDQTGSTEMANYTINVRCNTITFAENQAMLYENVKSGLDISCNQELSIKYQAGIGSIGTGNTRDVIRINNCANGKVNFNLFIKTSGGNTLKNNPALTGIYINNTNGSGNGFIVNSNTIQYLGSCIVWEGNSTNPGITQFMSNKMSNAQYCLYMNAGAAFNQQGTPTIPCGNVFGPNISVAHTYNNSGSNINTNAVMYVNTNQAPTINAGTSPYVIGSGIITTTATPPLEMICPSCGAGGGETERFIFNESSVEESSKASFNVVLYPNPNNGQMKIDYPELSEGDLASINIYDLNGKEISTFNLNNNVRTMEIIVNNLRNGIYIYKVFLNGNPISTNRLVIIK